jgi:hypothetical protein
MALFDDINLFTDRAGRVCAQVHRGGRLDVLHVGSDEFEDWLIRRHLDNSGGIPKSSAIRSMVKALRAEGQTTDTRQTWVRFAAPTPKEVFLDLANDVGEVVRVDDNGWEIVQNPDLPFRRPAGMQDLPRPRSEGSLSELRPLLNARDERTWKLLVGFLVATLQPSGTMPILVLRGEQGALKSSTARILRSIVDPRKAPLRRMSRSERDLMVAAESNHVLAFDNVSAVTDRLSDALCSIASGGGYATRQLYTDRKEIIIEARRPIILNGIGVIVKRDDLADRALQITLPPVPQEDRESERWVQTRFEEIHARVLDALLDAVSSALQNRSKIDPERQPRLADFTTWVEAAEPCLPWPEGQFMKAFRANRREAQIASLETNPLARSVASLVDGNDRWEGTPTSLLQELERRVPTQEYRQHEDWPASPSWVWRKLRRVKPILRRVEGIELDRSRTADRRKILVRRQSDSNDTN